MSHVFRFFATQTPSGHWILDEDEAEHARKVLKLKVGTEVEFTDGLGTHGRGLVHQSQKDGVLIAASHVEQMPPAKTLHALALGALKPGDIDEILPALVELGIREIHIFQQQDTAKFRTSDKQTERWDRIVKAAVKQSKQAWLSHVIVHESLEAALIALKPFDNRLVLDAAAEVPLLDVCDRKKLKTAAVVGGERGLNAAELAVCQSLGFTPVKMGPYVLRAKTAAVAVAAIFSLNA